MEYFKDRAARLEATLEFGQMDSYSFLITQFIRNNASNYCEIENWEVKEVQEQDGNMMVPSSIESSKFSLNSVGAVTINPSSHGFVKQIRV